MHIWEPTVGSWFEDVWSFFIGVLIVSAVDMVAIMNGIIISGILLDGGSTPWHIPILL